MASSLSFPRFTCRNQAESCGNPAPAYRVVGLDAAGSSRLRHGRPRTAADDLGRETGRDVAGVWAPRLHGGVVFVFPVVRHGLNHEELRTIHGVVEPGGDPSSLHFDANEFWPVVPVLLDDVVVRDHVSARGDDIAAESRTSG